MIGLGQALSLTLAPQTVLTPPFVGPLDDHTSGLAMAWSTVKRLLKSHAGALIRVRRSGDNAEMEIGCLADGTLDVDSLLNFCALNDGFIVMIYDQSGHGRDQIQLTATAQRRIVASGVLDTLGGLPTARCTISQKQNYSTAAFDTYRGTVCSVFAHAAVTAEYAYNRVLTLSYGTDYDFFSSRFNATNRNQFDEIMGAESGGKLGTVNVTYDDPFTVSSILDGTKHTMRGGNSPDNPSVAFTTTLELEYAMIGGISSTVSSCQNGDCFCEGAVFFADKTSDEAAIREAFT